MKSHLKTTFILLPASPEAVTVLFQALSALAFPPWAISPISASQGHVGTELARPEMP